jgi:hypothetical protein
MSLLSRKEMVKQTIATLHVWTGDVPASNERSEGRQGRWTFLWDLQHFDKSLPCTKFIA